MTENAIRDGFDEWYEALMAEGINCNRWDAWQACQYFSRRQIERDAVICESVGNVRAHGAFYAIKIRNQEK